MLRTAKDYLYEELNLRLPDGSVPASWFAEYNLPLIVSCTCCGMTMVLPSALIDDDGCAYCSSCAE